VKTGGGGRFWLLFVLATVLLARSPFAFAQGPAPSFGSTLDELREAGFADKEAILDRLIASTTPAPGRSSRHFWTTGFTFETPTSAS